MGGGRPGLPGARDAGAGLGPGGRDARAARLQWALLVTAVAVLLIGAAAGRLPGRSRALVLGAGAGIGFGVPRSRSG